MLPPFFPLAEKEEDVFISNNVVSVFFYSTYLLVLLNISSMMVAAVFAKIFDQKKRVELPSVSCNFHFHEKPKGKLHVIEINLSPDKQRTVKSYINCINLA
jgi:hypothetical protein